MAFLLVGCAQPKLNDVVNDLEFEKAFQGRRVSVIAPASGMKEKEVQDIINGSKLPLDVPDNMLSKTVPYLANTDEERFELLKSALYDPSTDIIWALRGGYGCARLIDRLSKIPKPPKEKIVIGYSDLTALHLFLSQKWGWKMCVHGPMLIGLLKPERDPSGFKAISDMIKHKAYTLTLRGLIPLNASAKSLKSLKLIKAPITGGNLQLLWTSIGTEWQVQADHKILFIEELEASGYTLDRSLFHLKQAGIFKHVKAIILGNCEEQARDHDIDIAIRFFADEMKVPVFKTDQFGHGKYNYPLVYNTLAELKRDEHADQFLMVQSFINLR